MSRPFWKDDRDVCKADFLYMCILQVDIVGHSRWVKEIGWSEARDHKVELADAIEKVVTSDNVFHKMHWAGDGGVFVALAQDASDGSQRSQPGRWIKAATDSLTTFKLWSEAHPRRNRLALRVSLHKAQVFVHSDPALWHSEDLNVFLKKERDIAIPGFIVITDEIFKALSTEDRNKWESLEPGAPIPWALYVQKDALADDDAKAIIAERDSIRDGDQDKCGTERESDQKDKCGSERGSERKGPLWIPIAFAVVILLVGLWYVTQPNKGEQINPVEGANPAEESSKKPSDTTKPMEKELPILVGSGTVIEMLTKELGDKAPVMLDVGSVPAIRVMVEANKRGKDENSTHRHPVLAMSATDPDFDAVVDSLTQKDRFYDVKVHMRSAFEVAGYLPNNFCKELLGNGRVVGKNLIKCLKKCLKNEGKCSVFSVSKGSGTRVNLGNPDKLNKKEGDFEDFFKTLDKPGSNVRPDLRSAGIPPKVVDSNGRRTPWMAIGNSLLHDSVLTSKDEKTGKIRSVGEDIVRFQFCGDAWRNATADGECSSATTTAYFIGRLPKKCLNGGNCDDIPESVCHFFESLNVALTLPPEGPLLKIDRIPEAKDGKCSLELQDLSSGETVQGSVLCEYGECKLIEKSK